MNSLCSESDSAFTTTKFHPRLKIGIRSSHTCPGDILRLGGAQSVSASLEREQEEDHRHQEGDEDDPADPP